MKENGLKFLTRRQFIARTGMGLPGLAIANRSFGGNDRSLLEDHVVTRVEEQTLTLKWPRFVGKNAVREDHGRSTRIRACILSTNQGATGWGLLRWSRMSFDELRQATLGKSVGALFHPEHGYTEKHFSPLEFALYDLAGVILKLPVWKLIGGDAVKANTVYSGMIYFDDLAEESASTGIDKILEECRWDYAYGYRQFKIKIGRGHRWMAPDAGLARDIEVVRQVHAAFPDCDILVDGNDGFTTDFMERFLEGVEDIPLFWIEEPFRENREDYRVLNRHIGESGQSVRHIADGEFKPDVETLESLEAERLVTVRLTDIAQIGFTRWRELLPQLAKNGIGASPHAWGSFVKTVYVAHLASAMGNMPTIEGVTCFSDEINFGENRIGNGKVHPSSEPGFGIHLTLQ